MTEEFGMKFRFNFKNKMQMFIIKGYKALFGIGKFINLNSEYFLL